VIAGIFARSDACWARRGQRAERAPPCDRLQASPAEPLGELDTIAKQAAAPIERLQPTSLLLLSKLEIEALSAACYERRKGGRSAERAEALLRIEV
jgi:hypothetical protein